MKADTLSRKIADISRLNAYSRPQKIRGAIKLDSNENFVIDRRLLARAVIRAAKSVDIREYPIDELDSLQKHLSKYVAVKQSCIAVGNGSDQIIELLLSTLGHKRATVFSPTFSYFINRCALHGIKVDEVPLRRDFSLNVDDFIKGASRSDMLYLCSPNNPTGNQFEDRSVISVLDSVQENTLVIIDEAYVDFSDHSMSKEAISRKNVVVLRTLSKAFGLAGARVGYMIANEQFANAFRTVMQSPYPISSLSLVIAASVLDNIRLVRNSTESIVRERKRIMQRLAEIPKVMAYRSDANFIFLETGDNYKAIGQAFAKKSILVKMLGNVAGHHGCMRVTIGTSEVNDLFLDCIEAGCA